MGISGVGGGGEVEQDDTAVWLRGGKKKKTERAGDRNLYQVVGFFSWLSMLTRVCVCVCAPRL